MRNQYVFEVHNHALTHVATVLEQDCPSLCQILAWTPRCNVVLPARVGPEIPMTLGILFASMHGDRSHNHVVLYDLFWSFLVCNLC